ncbi:MAG: ribbon-helix-helix protein, CopG family [Dehalococcoidia bacterium]|nr:ribbon-helix-helix protein, CopG family [Dehalococcoidia bacterium]
MASQLRPPFALIFNAHTQGTRALCKICAMRRLQILMDEELDDALERMARQTKRSKSDLVREFVRARVRPLPPIEEDPLWEMIGVDDYEPADIDEVVYDWPARPASSQDHAAATACL